MTFRSCPTRSTGQAGWSPPLVDAPVCSARVHIDEVDKLWLVLRRLPDYQLLKLRDELVVLLKNPPLPDPPEPSGYRPSYQSLQLGMDPAYPGQYLTRIQPAMTPVNDYEWVPLNEHYDMAWAYFETENLEAPGTEGSVPQVKTAGKYELKLELFNVSGGTPALVNWSHPTGPGSAGIDIRVANIAAPFTPPAGMDPVDAPGQCLLKDGAGDVVGFRMVVHVDTRRCSAAMDDVRVTTPGLPEGAVGPCGFLHYSNRTLSNVVIGFTAGHPGNHADFYFEVDKGSSGAVGEACADYSNGVRWAWVGQGCNGFTETNNHFEKPVPVATMLDSHFPCATSAAFAETLSVYARATDGYQRAYSLDAWALTQGASA